MKYVSRTNEVLALIKAKVKEARIEAAEEIGDLAQAMTPVRTGELRDSKRVEHEEDISRVGFTAEHAIFRELGDSRSASSPFLTPAFHQGEKIFERKLKEKLKEVK